MAHVAKVTQNKKYTKQVLKNMVQSFDTFQRILK